MGLEYEEFREAVTAALDPNKDPIERRAAEDKLFDLMEINPISSYPGYPLRLFCELPQHDRVAKDSLWTELVYGWALPRLADIVVVNKEVRADAVQALKKAIGEKRKFSQGTWRDMAMVLEKIAPLAPEAFDVLRLVPSQHQEAVLRDSTLRRLALR